MSYNDFLELIFTPIRYFSSWLNSMATMLSTNYFYITIFGIVLFVSLFWLIYDIIDFFFYSKINDYDDFNNRVYDYKIFKQVQADYLNNNRLAEFEYKYNLKVLNEQVLYNLFKNNQDLLISNRKSGFVLSHKAFFGNDILFDESSPAYHNYVDRKFLSDKYNQDYKDYEINRRAEDIVITAKASTVAGEILKKERDEKKQEQASKIWVNALNENRSLTKEEEEEFEDLIDNF